jgi:hypothetical protein
MLEPRFRDLLHVSAGVIDQLAKLLLKISGMDSGVWQIEALDIHH